MVISRKEYMESKSELLEWICDNLHLLNNDELGEVVSICMRSYQNMIVSESLKIKDPKHLGLLY